MANEVSIIIRVNDSEAEKLRKMAEVAKLTNREILADGEATARKQMTMAERNAAALFQFKLKTLGENEAAEKANATALQAFKIKTIGEQAAFEKGSAEALQSFKIKTLGETAAAEKAAADALFAFKIKTLGETAAAEIAAVERMDALHAHALAEDIARTAKRAAFERESAVALRAFKIKTLGENVAAEIAAQDKLGRIHAAAIAEDIAREKARTAAIIREREKAGFASKAATGALSAAGLGMGFGPVGVGLAVGGAAIFTSVQSQNLERAQRSIAAVTGSLETARGEMVFVEKQADRLGASVTDLAGTWSRFEAASKGTNLEGEKARQVFLAVGEAGAKLNLRSFEVEGALRAVEQMMSKGKVQAEELRGQLGDRLPGAFNIMARALGVSTSKLDDMLKKGQVLSEDALPAFAEELRRTFGTDTTTRIDTTTASFTRLWNEIKLTAAAIGDKLNPVLATSSEWMAEFLKDSREYGFGAALAGSGVLDRQFEAEKAERLRGLDQVFTTDYTTGRSTFDFAPAALGPQVSGALAGPKATPTGTDLLSAGVRERTDAELQEIETLQRGLALVGKRTELEKVEWEILKGKYKDSDIYIQNLARENAIAQDAEDARKAAAKNALKDKKDADKAQKEADKEAEKALQLLVRKEEAERRLTQQQMVRNEIDRQQLELGRNLTTSERELVELQMEGVSVSATSLENETRIGGELERQILARRQIKQDADEAASSLEGRVRQGPARKDIRDAQSYGEIDSIGDDAIKEAEAATLAKVAALEEQRQTQADINRDYDALELAAWEELESEKTRITQEQNDARTALTQAQAQVVGSIFGNLADVAQTMGKKGFKAYKAFAIAEATASMFSGAVGAFAQASKAFPPPYGQILGGVAAAAVVASGLAQIAQIKALQYEGGRRFGGPVSAHGLYEVVENREPEVFKSKEGRVWMIPGADGNVHPAKDAAAAAQSRGMGGMNVRVVNPPGVPLRVDAYVERGELVLMLEDAQEKAARTAEDRLTRGLLENKGRFGEALATKTGVRQRQVR